MLRALVLTFLAIILLVALRLNVHLLLDSIGCHRRQNKHLAITNDDSVEWNIDEYPSIDATDHLVFETVHSLLQRWPNARTRNGHNVVPGIIPTGTLLYHGSDQRELPQGPEWVSMDPEFSYIFCEEKLPQQGCWQMTLVTTRPLKVVYFDGHSAAKLPDGVLDTQDLIIWGGILPNSEWDEIRRIKDICRWGEVFGVDGFVRMSVDFEVMLCNFTSGVMRAFLLNLPHVGKPTEMTGGLPIFQNFVAGSWHNRFPGETRVQLDLAGMVSFYDTNLVPSLVAVRAGQERWEHRAQNISGRDLSALKSRLEESLIRPPGNSSGIDWKTLIQIIVDRFAGRLELTRYLLNTSTTDSNAILDAANQTQTQLRVMLTPHILLSAMPTDPLSNTDLAWVTPIYKLCATTHTHWMDALLGSMTNSERLILQAVRGTSREICRVVTKMWAAGVYAGIDASLNTKEFPDTAEVTRVWKTWGEDLNRLMAWLDWSIWVKCNPECSPEEICYLPMWPLGFPDIPPPVRMPSEDEVQEHFKAPTTPQGRLVGNNQKYIESELDGSIRPQPRCIRQVDTFEF